MTIEAAHVPDVPASAVRKAKVSFKPQLDEDELLTGTPTRVEVGSSDLTLGAPSRNGSTITVQGQVAAANEAVTFTVEGQRAGTTYAIRVSCPTDGGQLLVVIVKFTALDDGT